MFINDLFNKKQKLKESNRAGNNALRNRDDYLDKKEHLLKLLSMPNVPVEDKAVIRDRLAQLEQAAKGLKEEAEPSSVVQAITRRIISQRTDLLKQYGPEKVVDAIDEVADFVGDVDEIGTSDVSGWVKHVEQLLGNMSDQDVKETQLNEYLVRSGEPVSSVLSLNLFQDTSPDGQEGMAHDPRWQKLMKKYQPIANALEKQILALDQPLTNSQAEEIENVWYDGSDAYDDMEVEYLANCYNRQIATIEAIIAGELQDDEFEESRDDAYTRDLKASQTGFDDSSRRASKRAELQQELGHETNNIQIAINGKPWKVIPGKGYADSAEERSYLQGMKRWAEKKSASSGKKWTVYLTGANVSEGAELKQIKRNYNQAAKDSNADQAGAGKKIDTMKNSLRQKDIDKKKVAEGEEMSTFAALKDWQVWNVHVFNNFYRGKYADYGPRLYSVVAGSPEQARQVVIDNAEYVLQDLLSRKLQNGKRVLPRQSALPIEEKRVGKAEPGSITTMALKKMLTPDGVQSFKFSNGKIVDGAHVAGGEQVEEASFDYTMKDLGNDYAGFPSNHSMKHKFLAKIKPEKQQLYKDKMNNTHEWDSLFALFKVAKARGDILEQGVAEEQKPGFGEFPPKQEITIVPPKKLKSGETYQDRNKYWQSQGQAPIYKTNEDDSEFEPTHGKSPEDLGGADAYYHRGCNPGKYGFERGSIAWDSYLKGYKSSDEGPTGGKQWESAATEDDVEKHMMEMRHAGYGIK
jgi:hypothetical protein